MLAVIARQEKANPRSSCRPIERCQVETVLRGTRCSPLLAGQRQATRSKLVGLRSICWLTFARDMRCQSTNHPRRKRGIEVRRMQDRKRRRLPQSQQLVLEPRLSGRHVNCCLRLNANDVDRDGWSVAITWRIAVDDHLQRVEAKVWTAMHARKTVRQRGSLPTRFGHFGSRPTGVFQAGVCGDGELILTDLPAPVGRRLAPNGTIHLVGNPRPDVLHAAKGTRLVTEECARTANRR